MFYGRHPDTGQLLGHPHGENGVPAFDLVLRPTKSLSLLYDLGDVRVAGGVLDAHHQATGRHLATWRSTSARDAGTAATSMWRATGCWRSASVTALAERWRAEAAEHGVDIPGLLRDVLGRDRQASSHPAADDAQPTDPTTDEAVVAGVFDRLAGAQGLTTRASTLARPEVIAALGDQPAGADRGELEGLADRPPPTPPRQRLDRLPRPGHPRGSRANADHQHVTADHAGIRSAGE